MSLFLSGAGAANNRNNNNNNYTTIFLAKDVGKVVGGFLSSAFVHSFAAWCVSGGSIPDASGELYFFTENGIAVLVEEGVKMLVFAYRRRQKKNRRMRMMRTEGGGGKEKDGRARSADNKSEGGDYNEDRDEDNKGKELREWYDEWAGRAWFIIVVLSTGRNFARGWVGSGLVREMAELGKPFGGYVM